MVGRSSSWYEHVSTYKAVCSLCIACTTLPSFPIIFSILFVCLLCPHSLLCSSCLFQAGQCRERRWHQGSRQGGGLQIATFCHALSSPLFAYLAAFPKQLDEWRIKSCSGGRMIGSKACMVRAQDFCGASGGGRVQRRQRWMHLYQFATWVSNGATQSWSWKTSFQQWK